MEWNSTTTNIYVGNINPTVNENDLCEVFGKYGPLASIKIMWPRTDEERARNRNSGFVAYMCRLDADRALKALNGKDLRGYDMKLGWGKAVPIPQIPVYIPPELLKIHQPPPQSGLPFNAQLHESDLARGYTVPNPCPRPLPPELEGDAETDANLKSIQEAYEEFVNVIERSTVRVTQPLDRALLDRIHKTIEYLLREGPVFEAIIIARESKNPAYRFLYDNQSQEHIYYRWKLYSLLHGDNHQQWRTEPFKMFVGGSWWKPPPLNPWTEGMLPELVEAAKDKQAPARPPKKPSFTERTIDTSLIDNIRIKGSLGAVKREILGDLLRDLNPTKAKIGAAMLFCINHADAASEIIECIYESLQLLETPFQKKLARLFLISDILHNCSAPVTNASYYRKGFQVKLVSMFQHLREYLINIEDRCKADRFKHKVLAVLGAWEEWTLYEDEFVIQLSNILLGIKSNKGHVATTPTTKQELPFDEVDGVVTTSGDKNRLSDEYENNLDGEPIDDKTLAECLDAKGLSLRWYKTLELSDDEMEEQKQRDGGNDDPKVSKRTQKDGPAKEVADEDKDRIRFKSSKWETVDPEEVAEQVVTMSKWEAMAQEEDKSPATTTDGSTGETPPQPDEKQHQAKRIKRSSSSSSSSSSTTSGLAC